MFVCLQPAYWTDSHSAVDGSMRSGAHGPDQLRGFQGGSMRWQTERRIPPHPEIDKQDHQLGA